MICPICACDEDHDDIFTHLKYAHEIDDTEHAEYRAGVVSTKNMLKAVIEIMALQEDMEGK